MYIILFATPDSVVMLYAKFVSVKDFLDYEKGSPVSSFTGYYFLRT